MKVLQINSVYAVKSTGRNCAEIQEYLLSRGDSCVTAYGFGTKEQPNTYKIDSKAEYYLHNALARITGLQGYFSRRSTKRFIRRIKEMKPDIIHLHNLHANYLNLPILFNYLNQTDASVVVSLHDFWLITGKCPYFTVNQCDKWRVECHHCPRHVVKEYPSSLFFDFSAKMQRDKKRWLNGIQDLTVLGVSKWAVDLARQSFLERANFDCVYNWVDTEKFHPYLPIEQNNPKFRILCVSAIWIAKSVRYLHLLHLADIVTEDMEIIVLGQNASHIIHPNIRGVEFTESIEDMAKLYSSADVYVHLSEEDTFGKVIIEAMACGTPVVAFDTSVFPEIVISDCGELAQVGNVDDVLTKVFVIKKRGKSYYTNKCIEYIEANFRKEVCLNKLIEIYEHLIEEKANKK